MRAATALLLVLTLGASASLCAETHHFTRAQRYAGCLFGETVPLMRHGWDRDRALSAASDRCVALSSGLSAADVRAVDLDVHRAIEKAERQGL